MILIEPVLFDKETSDLTPQTLPLAELMHKSINSRKTFWLDVDSAKEYLTKRSPWSSWHPDILKVYLVRSLALVNCVSTQFSVVIDAWTRLCQG